MSVTLDANILIYAWNEDDPVHEPARALVMRLLSGPELLYLFWPVLLGFMRIATHPSILQRPGSLADVMENVTTMLERPHVRAPGEAEGFWSAYRRIGDQARGNAIPDAHVAALMQQYGVGVIYTRDRGFRRFDGIEARNPFI